jgi:hypothetical protein
MAQLLKLKILFWLINMLMKSKKEKSKRGGKRNGSGQKLKYNEETKTVAFRCPLSKVEKLKEIVNAQLSEWLVLK